MKNLVHKQKKNDGFVIRAKTFCLDEGDACTKEVVKITAWMEKNYHLVTFLEGSVTNFYIENPDYPGKAERAQYIAVLGHINETPILRAKGAAQPISIIVLNNKCLFDHANQFYAQMTEKHTMLTDNIYDKHQPFSSFMREMREEMAYSLDFSLLSDYLSENAAIILEKDMVDQGISKNQKTISADNGHSRKI